MGASIGGPQFSVIRPNYVDETIRLLKGRPPEDIAVYLIVVATELYDVGKLTPAIADRIARLTQRVMRLDKAA